MKRVNRKRLRWGTGAAIALLLLGVTATTAFAQQPLFLVDASYWFNGEQSTVEGPVDNAGGGLAVYSRTLMVDHHIRTFLISISTTGDTHDNLDGVAARLLVACTVEGNACRSGLDSDGHASNGWTVVMNTAQPCLGPGCSTSGPNHSDSVLDNATDLHDNNVSYTWCVRNPRYNPRAVGKLPVDIEVKIASDNGGAVFIEKSTFTVMGVKDRLMCRDLNPVEEPV